MKISMTESALNGEIDVVGGSALVHDLRERDVKDVVIVDGQRQQQAHKLKLHLHVQVDTGCSKPEGAQVGIHAEHAKVGIKQLPHQQLEKFLHARPFCSHMEACKVPHQLHQL